MRPIAANSIESITTEWTNILLHSARRTLFLALMLCAGLILLPAAATHAAETGEAAQRALSTPELIEQAFAAGEITADERLLYLAYAIYEPASLPAAFRSDTPWFGTAVVAELRAAVTPNAPRAAFAEGSIADEVERVLTTDAATVCDNEDGPNSVNSANFHINYGTIGGGLTVQDYADSLDQAFDTEVSDYGWAKPPYCEAGVGACRQTNPWNRYPVQVAELSAGLYGYVTWPGGSYAAFMGDNPNTPETESAAAASCMVLNRDYTGFPGGAQFSLDVTTAHEFAHSIQFGYGDPSPGENAMWYESTAAYVEDEVLDDANDNYQYLWPEFDRCLPNVPLSPFLLRYAYWPFFRYAAEHNGGTNVANGGEDLFEDFWANVAQGQGALTAYDNALGEKGTNFNDTFHEYAIATGFLNSCPGSAPYCYEEATGYRNAAGLPEPNGAIAAVGQQYVGSLENHYALNWVSLPVAGPYSVIVDNVAAGGELRVSIVAETPNGLDVTPLPATVGGGSSGSLPAYAPPANATRVLAVITNQEVTSDNPSSCSATGYRVRLVAPAGLAIAVEAPPDKTVPPGESTIHTYSLRNSGTESGVFTLSLNSSRDWADGAGVPPTMTIASNAVETVSVPVYVPANAASDSVEVTELSATAVEDSNITASAAVRTTAKAQLSESAFLPVAMRDGVPSTCLSDLPGESDDIGDALTICLGQTVNGSVNQNDSLEVYRIEATAGGVLELELSGTGGDSDLYLFGPNATSVNSDGWVAASRSLSNSELIYFPVPQSGSWYILVFAYEGATDYTLVARETENDGFYSCTADPAGDADNIDDAVRICSGQFITGAVSQADVNDVYRINAPLGWYLSIHLDGTGGDADLYLFSPDASDVDSDEPETSSATDGNREWIAGLPLQAGDWHVNVYAYDGTTDYELTVYLAAIASEVAAAGIDRFRLGDKEADALKRRLEPQHIQLR